jgi:hypothetical protein
LDPSLYPETNNKKSKEKEGLKGNYVSFITSKK